MYGESQERNTKMGIDTLKSVIGNHQGFASVNRFLFMLPADIMGGDEADHEVFVQTAQIPMRNLLTQEIQTSDVSGSMIFGYKDSDITLTFLLSNDYFAYDAMMKWLDMILDVDKYQLSYPKDYKKDCVLYHLDATNREIAEFKLENAWPSNISQIELSNTNENQIGVFTVELHYTKFIYNKLT